MELTYLRDLTHNYLVVRMTGDISDYTLRMALTCRAEGLVPCERRVIDGTTYIYCRTDSLLSLENRCLTHKLGAKDYRGLIAALVRMERSLKEYLLGTDALYLTPETVFFRPSDGTWHFLCLPGSRPEGGQAEFCEAVLPLIAPEEDETLSAAYRLCMLAREAGTRPKDLMAALDAFSPESAETPAPVPEDKEMQSAPGAGGRSAPFSEAGWVELPALTGCDDAFEAAEEEDTAPHTRNPAVRPEICCLLFTLVFFADLYIRKTYLLTDIGSILSLAVMGISLCGAVGAFLWYRRGRQGKDAPEREEADTPATGLWEEYDEEPSRPDPRFCYLSGEDDAEEAEGTVVLAGYGNRRASKLYGRNREGNCNIALEHLPLTVGKLAGHADFLLRDRSVSRVHAFINRDAAGDIVIKDMNSTNGTFHNGIRLLPNQSVTLRTGDEICFGNMVFEYL